MARSSNVTPRRVGASFGAALLVGAALFFANLFFEPADLRAQTKAPAKTPSSSATSPQKKPTKKRAKKRVRRPRGQQAPAPERILDIQQALAREGHYKGAPTGKWDAASIEAVKSFQLASGFAATGKLDARTLQKLGLGSEVAGVAPPRSVAGNGDPPASPRP